MKFTCERCDAQYMISDEKVGPNGVKVRCKKCSNVILVRRAAENGAVAPEAPAPSTGTGTGEHALDTELGQAFDHAFGDTPAKGTPAPGPDLDATQAVSSEEASRLAAHSAPPEPAASEWYVAIGQAQVGPLPLVEVRRKWEGGDVGPDSLVWRPGMGDWAPLSSVSDLAAYLSPVPRARAPEPAAAPAPAPVVSRAAPGAAPSGAKTPAPAADVSWKPVAASALAALASEEIAAQTTPEPKAESKGPGGARSLVDGLPDGGGVDPTGAIPLPIKALEATSERKIERKSSVARGAAEIRHKRSSSRAAAIGAAAAAGVLGLGAAAYLYIRPQPVPPAAPAPVASAAPAARPAAEVPPPRAPAAPKPAASGAASAASDPVAAPVARAEPPAAPEPQKAPEPARSRKEPPPRVARADPPARRRDPPARAEPRAEPPAPAPARKKGGSVLDFESNDAALEEALGGGGSGRTVYVPPPPGGAALAERVTDSQVNETILGRVSSLQQCVAEQKARDPDASGVLKMRWTIAPDGSVKGVKCLTSQHASSPFAQCLSGVLRGTRFPRSAQGRQEVTFPIKF
jgi:predicted Zn finger-like uncharacterized protein